MYIIYHNNNIFFNDILVYTSCTSHYKKKNRFSPLAVRHVYGHCTRGELLATCKWSRKYTWWIRLTLTAQLATWWIISCTNFKILIKIMYF
jgi:hypothetical protein